MNMRGGWPCFLLHPFDCSDKNMATRISFGYNWRFIIKIGLSKSPWNRNQNESPMEIWSSNTKYQKAAWLSSDVLWCHLCHRWLIKWLHNDDVMWQILQPSCRLVSCRYWIQLPVKMINMPDSVMLLHMTHEHVCKFEGTSTLQKK